MTDPKLLGSLGDCTLVILTDAESRLIRQTLEDMAPPHQLVLKAMGAFNAGIARGTARLQQEAKDAAKRKREGK